ncbi:MAG: MoaD/ThiS family protein [Chloroflexi bacterium]|nr:MoaD/ThiS family protein [Chloroflexota bacterium]
MDIRVLFFGRFRELATHDRIVPLNEGAQLADLLDHLSKEYGADFRNELSKTEEIHILVNGQYHSILNDMKTQLRDGDEVVLMPLVTGG